MIARAQLPAAGKLNLDHIAHFIASGFAHGDLDERRLYVAPPSNVGGIIVFESKTSAALDFGPHAA